MIGFFDSGYGGITVLKPVFEAFPHADYLYLGDNARAPYGSHSAENIFRYTEEAVKFFIQRGVDTIVIACNTASSTALPSIAEKYPNTTFFGVIEPTAQLALNRSLSKKIGVVGTKATIGSGVYEKTIQRLNEKAAIVSKACPLIVPFIEENWHNKPEAKSVLKKYLNALKSHHIDTLILGCTHYPLMQKQFQRIMGKNVQILTSGEAMLPILAPIMPTQTKKGSLKFLTTEAPERFQAFVEKNFGMKISLPERVQLTPIQ